MVHSATLKLSQLKLDNRNYRLGETSTQRDTIRAMIADQKRKLVNHARDVVTKGLSPGEFVWVMPDPKDSDMFIVLEGNRRVASLKLMETPALADGTILEKQFKQLAKKYYESPIREIDVRVFTTRVEARPWIRRRHMTAGSGVGLERWKPAAKGRAMRDEGESAPRFLAVIEMLDDQSEAWEEIESALDARWTTVDRILNSSSMPKILGINIHPRTGRVDFENGDVVAGKALLRRILTVMATPDFEFEDIEKATDRENFIKGFADWAVKKTRDGRQGAKPDPAKLGDKAAPTPSLRPPTAVKHSRPSRDSTARDTLAPKSGPHMLHVENVRLNNLYRECRAIKVKGFESASAFLLRVFIELSSEALLAAKKVQLPNRLQKEGKSQWSDIGIPLATKIECAVAYLDPSGKDKKFQQARVAAQPATRSSYSIHTLHGYFHNLKFIPDAQEVKHAWDAWETYLHEIHNALSPSP